MPAIMEIRCDDEECYLDMFENHYTYDLPADHGVTDLTCPVCGSTDSLVRIEV